MAASFANFADQSLACESAEAGTGHYAMLCGGDAPIINDPINRYYRNDAPRCDIDLRLDSREP